jgi:hypothetical protein
MPSDAVRGKVQHAVDAAINAAIWAAVGNKAYTGVLYEVYDKAQGAADGAVWLEVTAAVEEALDE